MILTSYQRNLNSTISGYSGYSVRCVIPASQLTNPTGAKTLTRISLSGVSLSIGSAFIGHKANGTTVNFSGTPVQLKRATLNSFVINGDNVVLDDCNFVWDGVSDIIVSVYITSGSIRRTTASGFHFEVAGDKASQIAPTGYYGSQNNPNICTLVSKIEMDGFETVTPPVNNGTFEVFGAIRNNGTGWSKIQDSEHQPLNIDTVTDMGSFVRITYGKTASKVGTLLITPDETYAQSGHTAGASVGLSYADIYFAQNGVAKTPAQVSATWGNFWIYGKMWE